MYFWLFVVVFFVWLWLAGGSLTAWRSRRIGAAITTVSVLVWTGAAALALLFVGPYWQVFGQPG